MAARVSVHCRDCYTLTRVTQPDKQQYHGPPQYCPYCGSSNTSIMQDSEQDWRDVMEESYGVPWSDLEPLYEMWNQQRAVPRFRDYLTQLVTQYANVTVEEPTDA